MIPATVWFLTIVMIATPVRGVEPCPRGAMPRHMEEGRAAGYRYVTFVTTGARADDPLPMIVGLHYSGATPETIVRDFDGLDFPARIVLPRGKHPRRGGYSWFPSNYAGLPESAQKDVTFRVLHELSGFLAAVRRIHPTDTNPIVVGTSYGGDLAFLLAVYHPEQVLAAFAVAARFPSTWMPSARRCDAKCPLLSVMHGQLDRTVAIRSTRAAAARLAAAGFRVEFREYPGVGHDFSAGMKADFVGRAKAVLGELRR
jgi:phospholipase/carboxylesterase